MDNPPRANKLGVGKHVKGAWRTASHATEMEINKLHSSDFELRYAASCRQSQLGLVSPRWLPQSLWGMRIAG